MSVSEKPAKIINIVLTIHFFRTESAVEDGETGQAHQTDQRGGGQLPRIVGRIQPMGIRDDRC